MLQVSCLISDQKLGKEVIQLFFAVFEITGLNLPCSSGEPH